MPVMRPNKLLLPLVPLYQAGLWLRARRLGTRSEPIQRLRFPVVSIGNLSTGGAGKTPFTIALANALTRRGLEVDVLSRGYGRKGLGATRVTAHGAAQEFGDEPVLIAQQTGVPVYVARQRYEAGTLSEGDANVLFSALGEAVKPIIHLLDDGFQHRQLHRNVDILLVNRQDWEDRLLPAGNLREPIKAALRATILVIPAEDGDLAEKLENWGWKGPIWGIRRAMDRPAVNGPVAAFCGIARPDQFFSGLEDLGLQIAVRTAFADHHLYTSRDVERLVSAASAVAATVLLTTEKDLVRLRGLASAIPVSLPLKAVHLSVGIDAENQAIEQLMGFLKLGRT